MEKEKLLSDKSGAVEDYHEEEMMLENFFSKNGGDWPDVDAEYETFCKKHLCGNARRWAFVAIASVAAVLLALVVLTKGKAGDHTDDCRMVVYRASADTCTDVTIKHGDGVETTVCANIVKCGGDRLHTGIRGMRTLTTHSHRTVCAILEDGTEVWLNAGSQLIFPDRFDEEKRCVELKGEAYFCVAHDARRPFWVKSAGMLTHVLGTEFNINSYNKEKPCVTLVRGRVEISDGTSARLMTTPGDHATLSDGDISLSNIDTYPITAWKRGEFYFDDATLLDVAREIGRWYNVSVIFNNKEKADKHIFFSADRDSRVKDIVKDLGIIGDAKITLVGNQMLID